MFRFVEGEQIIHRNKDQKNIEELHNEGRINDVAFHVFVAGHLSQKVNTSSLMMRQHQGLRSQASTVGKPTETAYNFHFPHLKSLYALYAGCVWQYFQYIAWHRTESEERCQAFRLIGPGLFFFLAFH